jgi:hypothetical protein
MTLIISTFFCLPPTPVLLHRYCLHNTLCLYIAFLRELRTLFNNPERYLLTERGGDGQDALVSGVVTFRTN